MKRVGICYERQIRDDLPVSEYDIPMNFIVTEKRIIEIQA
ncbi:MAG: hypothetical protein J6N76_05905 [Lachnospiraceae bacterium]|nr:hypothetical protein [Lachnospiraceae bacterium]